ncbi:hypothetical protein ES703_39427 [subsurface metagenome]
MVGVCPGNYEVVPLAGENLNSGKQGMPKKLCTNAQKTVQGS